MGFGSLPADSPEGKQVEQHPLQLPGSPRRRVRLWCRSAPRFAPAHLSATGAQPGERIPTSVELEDAWLQYFHRGCTRVQWSLRRPGGAGARRVPFALRLWIGQVSLTGRHAAPRTSPANILTLS